MNERDELAANGDPRAQERTTDARAMLLGARLGLGVGIAALAAGTVIVIGTKHEGPSVIMTAQAGGALFGIQSAW